jgi:hypothetical protein
MGETFKPGDGIWQIVRKILGWMSDLYAQLVIIAASIGGGGVGTFSSQADLVCAVAGTRVQGATVTVARGVLVTASPDNVGPVYIGGSNVTNASGGVKGLILLQAGMPSQFIPVTNLNQLYINADNAGDRAGVILV